MSPQQLRLYVCLAKKNPQKCSHPWLLNTGGNVRAPGSHRTIFLVPILPEWNTLDVSKISMPSRKGSKGPRVTQKVRYFSWVGVWPPSGSFVLAVVIRPSLTFAYWWQCASRSFTSNAIFISHITENEYLGRFKNKHVSFHLPFGRLSSASAL